MEQPPGDLPAEIFRREIEREIRARDGPLVRIRHGGDEDGPSAAHQRVRGEQVRIELLHAVRRAPKPELRPKDHVLTAVI